MMERVDSRLPAIDVPGRHPFCDAVYARVGSPALFSQLVMRSAAQSQLVDVSFSALRPRRDVVDFGEVAGHVAARMRTPAILGTNVEVMHPKQRDLVRQVRILPGHKDSRWSEHVYGLFERVRTPTAP